ncbi:MAG: tyrosine-type recombinase/integrase [Anaerolineae bacterium]
MGTDENGRKLTAQTTTKALQKSDLTRAGEAANQVATDYLFADYRRRRATKTIRTQTAALLLWVQYLNEVGAAGELLAKAEFWAGTHFDEEALAAIAEYAQSQPCSLPITYGAHYCQHLPAAWQGVTWGLVEGFVKWLLNQGYSVASVNNRLSAVKVYARLAAKAGVIPPTAHALIREVRGYGSTEGKRVDEGREKSRVGNKKEEAIVLTAVQAHQLKTQHPPTPQGIRDRLLMCLLLDLGLRASEVAALTVADLDEPGYITVYRQKTDTTNRMELTADILAVLGDYERYMRKSGTLLRGSRKNGKLTNHIMSVRAIGARVKILGRDILGIWELSPHDLRHTWATRAARGSNPFVLRDAGGWTNMQTPGRYVERFKVVNEGIQLDY